MHQLMTTDLTASHTTSLTFSHLYKSMFLLNLCDGGGYHA